MPLYLLLFLCICNTAQLITAETTQCRKNLSISVVIPCAPKHFQHLHHLLVHFTRQTVLPKEIIIALSESHLIPKAEIKNLTHHSWPFTVHLLTEHHKMLAGGNRNRGAAHAQGDIILFQDADDIPHPQIIEIAKYFFETKDIVQMLYWYIPRAGCYRPQYGGPKEFIPYSPQNIPFTTYYHESVYVGPHGRHGYIQNGQSFVLRSVLDVVKFLTNTSCGEDVIFNQQVINTFPGRSILVEAHLALYRKSLSATDY